MRSGLAPETAAPARPRAEMPEGSTAPRAPPAPREPSRHPSTRAATARPSSSSYRRASTITLSSSSCLHCLAQERGLPGLRLDHRQRDARQRDLQGNGRRAAARPDVDAPWPSARCSARERCGSSTRRSTAVSGSSSAVRLIRRFQIARSSRYAPRRSATASVIVTLPCARRVAPAIALFGVADSLLRKPSPRPACAISTSPALRSCRV